MNYSIKMLRDADLKEFIPYTTVDSVYDTSLQQSLKSILNVKLDPADVLAGTDISITRGSDNATIAWSRPTNLTVQNNLTTTASGKGVLDASQGKVLSDRVAACIPSSEKGAKNGVATLDNNGVVTASQLPSYIDDIIEAYIVNSEAALSSEWLSSTNGGAALTPETGKIYIIMTSGNYQNKQYRWSGSTYVLCNPSDVNSVNGMTGIVTLKNLTIKTAANSASVVETNYNGATEQTITINVPTKLSHLENDKGFITTLPYASTTDAGIIKLGTGLAITDEGVAYVTGDGVTASQVDWNNVANKPSYITNWKDYITASDSITGNAATATKLQTKRTISLTGSVTGSGEFDGSGNLSIATTTNHNHNYAASNSAGGAANSALACTGNAATATKLQTKRTITFTGSVTGSGEFDGSDNLSIAMTTNHNHNYAGSTSAGGIATSAAKVENKLTLTKNNAASEYNGSAAISLTVPTVHTGTAVPASSLGQNGDIYILTA